MFRFIVFDLNLNLFNLKREYFSRFPRRFSNFLETPKASVRECIYRPTSCIRFIRSRVRVCTRTHVFQFSLRNNGKQSQMNGRKLACSFFFSELFQLRNADFTMRIELDCVRPNLPNRAGDGVV